MVRPTNVIEQLYSRELKSIGSIELVEYEAVELREYIRDLEDKLIRGEQLALW